MSRIIGLEKGTLVEGLDDLKYKNPDQVLLALVARGLLDAIAMNVLNQHLRLRVLACVMHPVRCDDPPMIHRDTGGNYPWKRAGNIFFFPQFGVCTEHRGTPYLHPPVGNEAPDAVILHYCFASA
jgi:hypothetical protein